MELVIVSGLSGSGKSTCLNFLEDMGYHCIDNMPIDLLSNLIQYLSEHNKVAIGIDIRTLGSASSNQKNLTNLFRTIENIKSDIKIQLKFLYTISNLEVISKRFNSTKRKHPLEDLKHDLKQDIKSIKDAFYLEEKLLEPLSSIADEVIDTSQMSPYDLQKYLFTHLKYTNTPYIFLQSFGFKNGTPTNSDFIFDVRFIPNPFWIEELRNFTGLDTEIIEFLKSKKITQEALSNIISFIHFIYRQNKENNKSYINISIGCTGGQHRSVYIVEQISDILTRDNVNINKFHRDLVNK